MRVCLSLGRATLLLWFLWLLFFSADAMLPYIRAGHVIIYSAKAETLCNSLVFPPHVQHKVLVFGNSTILSGFVPERFDAMSPSVASYNLGLPDSCRFIDELELLVRRGQIPTHVLFSVAWPRREEEGKSSAEPVDKAIINTLFPFRDLPRNVCLFMLRARARGGVQGYYEHGRASVQKMIQDRGYYFIEGQSHFPGHCLPVDFRLQSDRSDEVHARDFDLTSDIFTRLQALQRQYGIQFCIIPYYHREGKWAQPPAVSQNSTLFRNHSGFFVLGPEYFLFPNRDFSDPEHLNPDGARLYTEKLAALFLSHIGENEIMHNPGIDGSQGLEK